MDTMEFKTEVTSVSLILKPYAYKLTRDMDDAKDLLQETVYKAIVNQEKFREGSNLKAWMNMIMQNLFINEYRRRSKYTCFALLRDVSGYITEKGRVVFNDGEANIELASVREHINKINNMYKVPFMMFGNGYKYAEIADYLDLALGTVKSRIHFAKRLLQKDLKECL